MKEHNFSIRKLEEFSLLHNKAVVVSNKPKHLVKGTSGFDLSWGGRYE